MEENLTVHTTDSGHNWKTLPGYGGWIYGSSYEASATNLSGYIASDGYLLCPSIADYAVENIAANWSPTDSKNWHAKIKCYLASNSGTYLSPDAEIGFATISSNYGAGGVAALAFNGGEYLYSRTFYTGSMGDSAGGWYITSDIPDYTNIEIDMYVMNNNRFIQTLWSSDIPYWGNSPIINDSSWMYFDRTNDGYFGSMEIAEIDAPNQFVIYYYTASNTRIFHLDSVLVDNDNYFERDWAGDSTDSIAYTASNDAGIFDHYVGSGTINATNPWLNSNWTYNSGGGSKLDSWLNPINFSISSDSSGWNLNFYKFGFRAKIADGETLTTTLKYNTSDLIITITITPGSSSCLFQIQETGYTTINTNFTAPAATNGFLTTGVLLEPLWDPDTPDPRHLKQISVFLQPERLVPVASLTLDSHDTDSWWVDTITFNSSGNDSSLDFFSYWGTTAG